MSFFKFRGFGGSFANHDVSHSQNRLGDDEMMIALKKLQEIFRWEVMVLYFVVTLFPMWILGGIPRYFVRILAAIGVAWSMLTCLSFAVVVGIIFVRPLKKAVQIIPLRVRKSLPKFFSRLEPSAQRKC